MQRVDDPARHFEIGRHLVGVRQARCTNFAPMVPIDGGEQRAAEQAEQHDVLAPAADLSWLTSTSTPTWMPVRTP